MRKKITLSYIGLSLMTLIIGMSFIFVKIGIKNTSPYDLLAHRFNIGFISVAILYAFKVVKLPKISRKDWFRVIAISLFYPVLCFGFQAVGMQYSTASEAGVIFAFLPVFMLVVGRIFLKETTTTIQKIGVVLSVIGLVYIFWHKSGINTENTLGIVLLLISVLSMIGYFVMGKKIIVRYDSMSLTVVMMFMGFLIFNAISFYGHIKNDTISQYFTPLQNAEFTVSVLYLGILSSVLSSFLSNYALQYIPASKISIFSNLNPIIAIVAGVLLLKERFTPYDFAGSITVLFGVALVLVFKPKLDN